MANTAISDDVRLDGASGPRLKKVAGKIRSKRRRKETVEEVVAHRLQLSLPDPVFERLELVKARTGASSFQEVIRSALRIYDTLTEEIADDKRVYIEDRKDKSSRTLLSF